MPKCYKKVVPLVIIVLSDKRPSSWSGVLPEFMIFGSFVSPGRGYGGDECIAGAKSCKDTLDSHLSANLTRA